MVATSPSKPALIDLGLVSRLLGRALSRGAERAEIYVQRSRSVGLDLEDGEIKSARSGSDWGVGIRVLRGAAFSYGYSEDLSDEALLACADAAAVVAGETAEHPRVVGRPLLRHARAQHVAPPIDTASVPIAARAEVLRRAEAAARREPRVERVVAGIADLDEDILIATSDGLLVEDTRTLCRMSLDVIVADPNGKRRTGSAGGGARAGLSYFDEVLTPEAIGAEAVRMAAAQIGARPAPAGERVVVVGPGASGVLLHESVGHGLEADFARKKTSLYAGRLGQRVASELVTVIDDGTLRGRRGSLNVDDEGTPTSRTVLIERGVLKGYLTDVENARMLGMEATGNGRRQSFRHPPLPRMTNTYLLSGTDDADEIVRGVKSGLYARSFGGGQVDIASGSFVFEVREGYLIEDGKLTTPVEGASLVGNGPDVLEKVTAVAADGAFDPGAYTCGKAGQSVPVTVGLPTVRIDGITVGGRG